MFRWGILSTARIAREQLIPAIQESDNGTVHAVASRDAAKARALAERAGAPLSFGSYEALLACPQIDGVYIPLPTSHHVEWAVRAADAGKHVLVEKPLALKAADIGPAIAARERNRVLVAEAFMVVHHPQWAKVRALIAAGAIGRLRQVQGAFSYYNDDPADMRNIPELGGGALADIGVYPVVTTRFSTGREPLHAEAHVERDPVSGTDIHATARVAFDGFELSFYVSTRLALRQSMAFHGDRGFIEVAAPFNAGLYGDHVVTLHDAAHARATVLRFPGARQYRLQVEAFVRAARGEASARVFTLEESVLNQKVIDAIFRAGATGGREPV
ncbi:MAG: oxidoreductase [Hyphomicrobiales bacterium]|nr:MAG: oxidoreductase [Hyphomicrobiales bacterium]